jgi:hypothetical protein
MVHASPEAVALEQARVQIALDAYCYTCRHHHHIVTTPDGFVQEAWQWEAKHRGHIFEFLSPRRRLPARFLERLFVRLGWEPWWLTWAENADAKLAYVASAALTCSLGALGSSATFVAGREATSVLNNTTGVKYLDGRLTAKITTGTSPTVDTEIRIYGYAALNDTPVYPDTITGTDSAVTLTNTYILDGGFVLVGATGVSATSNIGYPIRCFTLLEAFGPHVPTRWGLFVAHNTGVALHATAGLHVLTHTGAYINIV